MLYKTAHYFRDHLPCLWDIVNVLNSFLFSIRYKKRYDSLDYNFSHEGYTLFPIKDVPVDVLVKFFSHQPKDAYMFFKPHGFDRKSLLKLQRNKAFLAYVLIDSSQTPNAKTSNIRELRGVKIAGYCFIRAFFHGKGFRGRIVDIDYRGLGLGTFMNKFLNDIGFGIGLRLFETVSKDNLASYRSMVSASKFKIVKELPHNELFLEILPNKK